MTDFNDLDMDAYNASNNVGKDELLLYVRCWDGKANIFVSGDPGVMIGALFTMFDSIENSFDTVLDAVLQYADENNIDIENYFEDGV